MKLTQFKKLDNLANLIAIVVTYVLYFLTILLSLRYMRLNFSLFLTAFGILFVLILLFGIVSLEGIIEQNRKLKIVGLAVLTVISLLLVTTVFYVSRINSSINNVIVDPTQSTEMSSAFVVYDSSKYTDAQSLSGTRMGVLSNSEDNDRNGFVKSEVESLGLNISFVEFLSYNDLLLGLFEKQIDVAALPADYYNQFSDYEGYLEYLDKTEIIHEFTTTVESIQEIVDIDVTKEPFSLLIMGNDGGRTDSLILATYNPIKLSVTMTSIPRDSYVPIACYPNQQKDKIGHAFSVSRDCALDTVENLFDIEVNYFVEVNFKGVVEIVDALDRVWLDSPVMFVGQNSDEERGHYTVWVPKGGFWATGEMALALARERYHMPGGDYQRQENQQQVIQAIIDRTLQLKDINKALAVLDAAGNNVKTNMSLNQMIEIFNTLMKAINKTNLEPAYMLDITGSRVMGYSSYTYNESLQLPLWISKPYNGSIEDMRKLMLSNLETQALPEKIYTEFNAQKVFYEVDYFAKEYNEKQEHERLPDFMPTMANNNWTLSDARTWANSRNITLTVDEIRSGNPLYNANVVHNYIVGQNVKYGVKTSNFNNLNIKVIKHELNCSLEENKIYEECKYKLPDFQDYGGDMTTISFVRSWIKDLGLPIELKFILIPETDPTYDSKKVGYVIKQNPVSWADVRTLSELTLTVMDPNYSILIPETSTWTETIARQWVKDNLEFESNIEVTYIPTTDTALFGKVVSTTPAKASSIKYQNSILKVSVYAEGYKLTSQVGKTKEDVTTNLCNTNIIKCSFIDVAITSEATQVEGTIASHDFIDVLKVKPEWTNTTVTFGVYKKVSTTPATP